jgi:excisionase family DNA binding protein
VHEVAYALKCSQETVRRLIREQKLRAFHLGAHLRVEAQELQAFMLRQRVTAGQNGNGEGDRA